MKVTLLVVGKTAKGFVEDGFQIFEDRLKHYVNFTFKIIPELKNTKKLSTEQQKDREAELIEAQLEGCDLVVLLDENGKERGSEQFAEFIQEKQVAGVRHCCFVVGGPYGFQQILRQKYKQQMALSKMTFSHQMVRLIFIEQLYRAFTILKGEPYHHK